MDRDLIAKGETFVQDAAIDTAADGAINGVVDGVTTRIPGVGGAIDAMAKTGIDLAANNFINAEIARVEGSLGGHETTAPPADPDPGAESS